MQIRGIPQDDLKESGMSYERCMIMFTQHTAYFTFLYPIREGALSEKPIQVKYDKPILKEAFFHSITVPKDMVSFPVDVEKCIQIRDMLMGKDPEQINLAESWLEAGYLSNLI